ncbi:MAG: hypothetical protein JKY88_08645 [Pseudomonadales bacterium]|nr:hypothetical protein [Pseudomonadales bacterium]
MLALIFTLVFSYFAILRGLADQHFEASRVIMSKWTTGIPKQTWFEALDEIELALKYDPGHGAHHYRRARLYHLCTIYLVDCGVSKKEAAKLAERDYQSARNIRPNWTLGIAHYALLKRDTGQLDQRFHELVQQAVTLGPRVPPTLRLISQIALTKWSSFDADEQQMLAEHLIRGLESPAGGVKKSIVEQLHKHSRQVDGAMITSLFGYLNRDIESADWDATFVDLTFLFWSKWPIADRLILVDRLNLLATSKRVNHVLKIAKDNHKLPIACAILVQSKAVLSACNNTKLQQLFNKQTASYH